MARKLLKLALSLAALGAVVIGAAAVAVKFHLPPAKLRELALARARKALGREVRFKDISLGVLRGLQLTGLEVSEAPDFKAGTFAGADSFRLTVQWLPLLSKKVLIDTVELAGLRLRVVKAKDGKFNFSDLQGGGAPAPKPAPASPAAPPDIRVSRARVSKGRVEFQDLAAGQDWKISEIELDLRNLGPDRPFDVEAALSAAGSAGGRPVAGSLDLAGRVDPAGLDLAKASVKLKRLELKAQGYRVELSGSVEGFSDVKADLALKLSDGEGELVSAKIVGRAARLGAAPYDVEAEIEGATPGFVAARIKEAKLPEAFAVPPAQAAAKFALVGENLKLERMKIAAGKVELDLSGAVADALGPKPRPDLVFSSRADVPAFSTSDLSFLSSVPKGLSLPKFEAAAKGRLTGEDLSLEAFELKSERAKAAASGTVEALLSGAPRPALKASLSLDLPAFSSKDIAVLPGVPPGLEIPPLKLDASLAGGFDAVDIESLRLVLGGTDLEVSGKAKDLRAASPALDLLLKCRSYSLPELAKIHPGTREMEVTGNGYFALSTAGRLPRPPVSGKLQFSELGAKVSGMVFSGYSGTVSANEKRIDLPNFAGKFGDGELALNVTVKDYTRSPEVEVEGSLTRIDLGKLMAAKAASEKAQPQAAAKPARSKSAGAAPPPVAVRGRFSIGQWTYSAMAAKDTRFSWDLTGLTSDLTQLDGWAKLNVGQGKLENLGKMATQSKIVKVLVFPLMVIQKIGKAGGAQVFPDLNNIAFDEIVGDYAFSKGVMTLKECRLGGSDATVSSTGRIELPTERLDLLVTAQVGRVAPIDVEVKGSFDNPSTKVKLLKVIADPAKRALEEGGRKLQEGGRKLLEGILKRK